MITIKKLSNKYKNTPENEIVSIAKTGEEEALSHIFKRYQSAIRSIASNYFFMGSDHEDVLQEGLFGLYKAIRDFNPEKSISFGQFARLCISRQIMATAKKASGTKHRPLNYYVSLNKHVYDEQEGNKSMIDIIPSSSMFEPDKEVIYYELAQDLKKVIKEQLSSFERSVVKLHLGSNSYVNIAKTIKM